jgi:CspA family cold shock protein
MTKGTVKWFSDQEGYGFISIDDENGDQKDIFVRYSDFECQGFKPVQKGVEVIFDIEEGENGPQAVRVCMAAGPHGGGGGLED